MKNIPIIGTHLLFLLFYCLTCYPNILCHQMKFSLRSSSQGNTNMNTVLPPNNRRFNQPDVTSFISDNMNLPNKSILPKYYQGSVIFNLPNEKNLPLDKLNLHVVNNFFISNSTVQQYINKDPCGNSTSTGELSSNPNKEVVENYEKKVKNIEADFNGKLADLHQQLLEQTKALSTEKSNEEKKVQEYEDKIQKLIASKNQDMNKLKEDYEKKLLDAKKKKLETEMATLQKQDNSKNQPEPKNTPVSNVTPDSPKLSTISTSSPPPVLVNIPINENSNLVPAYSTPLFTYTPVISNTLNQVSPPDKEHLACLVPNSVESSHFQMNYEKCKSLDSYYMQIVDKFFISVKTKMDIGNISCATTECHFEIFIKFKDEYTDISLMLLSKTNQLIPIKNYFISAPVYQIPGHKSMKSMDKTELKDYLTVYLYQPLVKIYGILPLYSQSEMIFIGIGDYFDKMSYEEKHGFIRGILSLESIDDRFKIDWNNVRIINGKEKNLQDYVLIKGSFSGEGNLMKVDIGENGVNVIGTEKVGSSKSNGIEGIMNTNQDASKTSVQIKSGSQTEKVYTKDVNIIPMNNAENSMIDLLSHQGSGGRKRVYDIPLEDTYSEEAGDGEQGYVETYPSHYPPESKIHDPDIERMKQYLTSNNLVENYLTYSNQPYPLPQIGFRFKENKSNEKLATNPCFNKGYYDRELNIMGEGDYEACYNYILTNNFIHISKMNSTRINNNNSNSTQKLFLGNEYKFLKFLFYERNNVSNVISFNEEMTYNQLKKKIANEVCGKQYSYIMAKYSSYHIKHFPTLCFDLTYFTVTCDAKGIYDSSILVIKPHLNLNPTRLNGKIEISLMKILLSENIKSMVLLFCLTFMISILLYMETERIISAFTRAYCSMFLSADKLSLSNTEIDRQMKMQNVKFYLFYSDNSHFQKKYGKDFDYEKYDWNVLISETKLLLTEDSELRNLITRNYKFFFNLQISIGAYMLISFIILSSISALCLLMYRIVIEFGIIHAMITLLSLLFLGVLFGICVWTAKKYTTKEETNIKNYQDDQC